MLRGMAAVLMIVNHAGYRLLSAQDALHSAVSPWVFLGSFAPAVFFFATGLGIGLSRSVEPRSFDWAGVLWKAALLIVADQFFFWGKGVGLGLDFFSFIAIATVCVSLLSRLRRAVSVCISLAALLLLTRYGFGPWWGAPQHYLPIFEWMLGVRGTAEISYPLSPWMLFPLLGFACGVAYQSVSLSLPVPRNTWLQRGAAVATLFFAIALVLLLLNRSFFRWGTVSISYLALAMAVVTTVGLLSMAAVMYGKRIPNALALRGVASFAVIPLHYAVLAAIVELLPQPLAPWPFLLVVACVICATFFGAAKFTEHAWRVASEAPQTLLFSLLVVGVFIFGLAIYFSLLSSWIPSALITLLAQLCIAVLLGMRLPTKT